MHIPAHAQRIIHSTRQPTRIALLIVAAALAVAPAATAQLPGVLPRNLPTLSSFSQSQLDTLKAHIEAHAPELASEDPQTISRHRDKLLEPLLDDPAATTVLFRDKYAQLLLPHLTPMLTSDSPDTAINATIVLGHLGTRSALSALEPALTDERASVRFAAYTAHAHTFRVVATSSGLPLSEQQASAALTALTDAFATETDPAAQEALVLALTAAAQVPESRLPSLRPAAVSALATSASSNISALSHRAAFRAATTLQLELTTADRSKADLPRAAHIDAARFVGHVLASTSDTLQSGPVSDEDRRTLATLVDTAERILYFAQQSLGIQPTETNLSRSISDQRDDSYTRAVDKLLSASGPLATSPFNIDPAAFQN